MYIHIVFFCDIDMIISYSGVSYIIWYITFYDMIPISTWNAWNVIQVIFYGIHTNNCCWLVLQASAWSLTNQKVFCEAHSSKAHSSVPCSSCCMEVSRTSVLNEYIIVIGPRFRQRIHACTVVVDESCCCRAIKLSGLDVYTYNCSAAVLATHTAVYRRVALKKWGRGNNASSTRVPQQCSVSPGMFLTTGCPHVMKYRSVPERCTCVFPTAVVQPITLFPLPADTSTSTRELWRVTRLRENEPRARNGDCCSTRWWRGEGAAFSQGGSQQGWAVRFKPWIHQRRERRHEQAGDSSMFRGGCTQARYLLNEEVLVKSWCVGASWFL